MTGQEAKSLVVSVNPISALRMSPSSCWTTPRCQKWRQGSTQVPLKWCLLSWQQPSVKSRESFLVCKLACRWKVWETSPKPFDWRAICWGERFKQNRKCRRVVFSPESEIWLVIKIHLKKKKKKDLRGLFFTPGWFLAQTSWLLFIWGGGGGVTLGILNYWTEGTLNTI